MTVYEDNHQRVSESALELISTDLCTRYSPAKVKKLLEAALGHRIRSGTKDSVFTVLVNASTHGNISYFLRVLEHVTNPLLFGTDSRQAGIVLQSYINTLKKENFHYDEGLWCVGPTSEEESNGGYDYWRNSKGEVLEAQSELILPQKVNLWVTRSIDGRDFFYEDKKIKWNPNDDIYKAFNTLYKFVNDSGFVSYADYEKYFKRQYPIDYSRIGDFRKWLLKNLTQKGEGVLKKTGDANLVVSVRKQGLQFSNKKLP